MSDHDRQTSCVPGRIQACQIYAVAISMYTEQQCDHNADQKGTVTVADMCIAKQIDLVCNVAICEYQQHVAQCRCLTL